MINTSTLHSNFLTFQFSQTFFPNIQFYLIIRMSMVPNIKYKTEFCRYWEEGKECQKGQGCFFAHGPNELRTFQQNQQDILTRNAQIAPNLTQPHNYKTIFCKFYAQGQCKLGDQCTYAHQRRERRRKQPSNQYNFQQNQTNAYWGNYQFGQYYSQYYSQLAANYWGNSYDYSLYPFVSSEAQEVKCSQSSPETDKSQNTNKQGKGQITSYEPQQGLKDEKVQVKTESKHELHYDKLKEDQL